MRTLLFLLFISMILQAGAQTGQAPEMQSFIPANNGFSIHEMTEASNNAF